MVKKSVVGNIVFYIIIILIAMAVVSSFIYFASKFKQGSSSNLEVLRSMKFCSVGINVSGMKALNITNFDVFYDETFNVEDLKHCDVIITNTNFNLLLAVEEAVPVVLINPSVAEALGIIDNYSNYYTTKVCGREVEVLNVSCREPLLNASTPILCKKGNIYFVATKTFLPCYVPLLNS